MCLTAYWIDDQWKLNRRILNFRQIPDCKAETIGEEIQLCLLHWGIDRILTLTLDDASSEDESLNDLLIEHLKSKTEKWKPTSAVLENEFLHVRSYVHILGLVVKDCLKEENETIVKIRNAIMYVKCSTGFEIFQTCVEKEKIEGNSLLYLNDVTMWNSTYLMLEQAVKFEKALDRLIEDDPDFKSYFVEEEIEGPPCKADWESARIFVEILSMFYDLTLKFSGSMQVTSSSCFHEMFEVQGLLNEWIKSGDILLSDMAMNVKFKFEKNWEKFSNNNNYLLYIAAVLDPRYKLEFVVFCLRQMYDEEKSTEVISKVESALKRLYEFYERTCPVNGKKGRKKICKLRRAKYLQFLKVKKSVEKKPELERYLQACTVSDVEDFDILYWWKRNRRRYPRLSRMAKEILAVSVTTVAPESAFFKNGNFLDEYLSSLYPCPSIIEILICTRNWLCPNEAPYDLREEILDSEKYDDIAEDTSTPI